MSEHRKHSEAIELLWRAFDRTQLFGDRMIVIQRLAAEMKETDQLESLYSRLTRESHEPAKQREMTIFLAKAHETAGDMQAARQILQPLLTDENRDTELLEYARTLAQRQSDFDAAIRIQRQLLAITGSEAQRLLLIQLLMNAGEAEQAVELLISQDEVHQLTADVLQLIDSLDQHGRTDQALLRVQALQKRFPDDWELAYRAALFNKNANRATELFVKLLRMPTPQDTPTVAGRSTRAQFSMLPLPFVERFAEVQHIKSAMLERKAAAPAARSNAGGNYTPRSYTTTQTWHPADFGEARIYAWCWLFEHLGPTFAEGNFPQIENPKTYDEACDRMIVLSVTRQQDQIREAVRQAMLMSPDDIEIKILYVQLMTNPLLAIAPDTLGPPGAVSKPRIVATGDAPNSGPLNTEQLDILVDIYREITARPELVPYNIMLLNGLTRELNLAGRHALANELIAEVAKGSTTTLEVAVLLFMQRTAPDSQNIITLLDRLIEIQQHPKPTMPAATTRYSTLLNFVSREQLSRQLLVRIQRSTNVNQNWEIWKRYVRLTAQHSAARPQISGIWQLTSAIQATQAATNKVAIKNVLRPVSAQPTNVNPAHNHNPDLPALVFDKDATVMFAFVAREFRSAQRSDALKAMIEDQITQAADAVEKLHWQHTLAELLWYGDRRGDALTVLREALEPFPLRLDLKYGLAQQYEVDRQLEQAFDVMASITPDSFAERRELNWVLFRMAVESKEPTRIHRILEQVSAGDVPDTQLVPIAREMAKQGMGAKAEAMLIQATKHHPRGIATSRALMDAQFASGLTDRAATTAFDILQDLDHMQAGVPAVRQVNGLLVEYQYGTVSNPADERQACYHVLNAAGQLNALIDQLEEKLEVSRAPEEILDRLMAMYTAKGITKRVELLGIQKQKLNLDKPSDRLNLALKYLDAGLDYLAIEQLQILVKKDPEYLASRIRPTLQRCETTDGLDAFAELILQLNWGQSINQLLVLPAVMEQISQYSELRPLADQLLVRTWQAHPERRVDLLQFFSDSWSKLSADLEQPSFLLMPTGPDTTFSPWATFGRTLPIQKDKTSAGLATVLNRLLSIAQTNGKLEGLATEAQTKLKEHPDWMAGEVLLALIDLRRDRVREGSEALKRLRPKLDTIMKTREFMAWEIGQELIRHHEGLDVGADYMLLAANDMVKRKDWHSESPGTALVEAYVSAGRVTDARALLLAQRSPKLLEDSTEVVSRAELDGIVGIGKRLQAIGYPMDAIDLYLTAIKHGGYTYRDITSALSTAVTELTPESMLQALKDRDSAAPLDLHLFDDARRLRTRWDTVWGKIAKDAETRSRFVSLMETVGADPQHQQTALIAIACVSILGDDLETATPAINKILAQDELPETPDESVRRKRRLNQIGLWLIARECLTRPPLAATGQTLGQRALDASRRTERDFHRAILKEWLEIATALNDAATIARLKAEIEKKL